VQQAGTTRARLGIGLRHGFEAIIGPEAPPRELREACGSTGADYLADARQSGSYAANSGCRSGRWPLLALCTSLPRRTPVSGQT